MKRLLLPLLAALALPTAVDAFPWNSGIVVKNDLREKINILADGYKYILKGIMYINPQMPKPNTKN